MSTVTAVLTRAEADIIISALAYWEVYLEDAIDAGDPLGRDQSELDLCNDACRKIAAAVNRQIRREADQAARRDALLKGDRPRPRT